MAQVHDWGAAQAAFTSHSHVVRESSYRLAHVVKIEYLSMQGWTAARHWIQRPQRCVCCTRDVPPPPAFAQACRCACRQENRHTLAPPRHTSRLPASHWQRECSPSQLRCGPCRPMCTWRCSRLPGRPLRRMLRKQVQRTSGQAKSSQECKSWLLIVGHAHTAYMILTGHRVGRGSTSSPAGRLTLYHGELVPS